MSLKVSECLLCFGYIFTCRSSDVSHNWARTCILCSMQCTSICQNFIFSHSFCLFCFHYNWPLIPLVSFFISWLFFFLWADLGEKYWHMNNAKHTLLAFTQEIQIIIVTITAIKYRNSQNSVNKYLFSTFYALYQIPL